MKRLLFRSNVKELKEYPVMMNVTEEEKYEYTKKKWRSFDVMDKLHNIIKYSHGSSQ